MIRIKYRRASQRLARKPLEKYDFERLYILLPLDIPLNRTIFPNSSFNRSEISQSEYSLLRPKHAPVRRARSI